MVLIWIRKGNYWDTFDEQSEGAYDNNNDGIIDAPYEIPGGSKDLYPLIKPFSQGQSHKGDYNNDGRIDVFDLDAFAQQWGSIDPLSIYVATHPFEEIVDMINFNFNHYFDFDNNGKIDVFDLDGFAQVWGKKYT